MAMMGSRLLLRRSEDGFGARSMSIEETMDATAARQPVKILVITFVLWRQPIEIMRHACHQHGKLPHATDTRQRRNKMSDIRRRRLRPSSSRLYQALPPDDGYR